MIDFAKLRNTCQAHGWTLTAAADGAIFVGAIGGAIGGQVQPGRFRSGLYLWPDQDVAMVRGHGRLDELQSILAVLIDCGAE